MSKNAALFRPAVALPTRTPSRGTRTSGRSGYSPFEITSKTQNGVQTNILESARNISRKTSYVKFIAVLTN